MRQTWYEADVPGSPTRRSNEPCVREQHFRPTFFASPVHCIRLVLASSHGADRVLGSGRLIRGPFSPHIPAPPVNYGSERRKV